MFSCITEILCTEKNSRSKLCKEVESMREQLSAIPRLEKKIEDVQLALSSTSDTIVTLSRALQLGRSGETSALEVDCTADGYISREQE